MAGHDECRQASWSVSCGNDQGVVVTVFISIIRLPRHLWCMADSATAGVGWAAMGARLRKLLFPRPGDLRSHRFEDVPGG